MSERPDDLEPLPDDAEFPVEEDEDEDEAGLPLGTDDVENPVEDDDEPEDPREDI